MSEGPYRPDPALPDAELARLAAEGQRRILDAQANRATGRQAADEGSREKNLRVALGGHYGSPLGKASAALIAVGAIVTLGNLVWGFDRHYLGELLLVAAVLVRIFVAPKATRARAESERRWAISLPFVLDGYFEVLGGEPRMANVLTVTLTWSDPRRIPGEGELRGLLGLVDTDARAESRDPATTVIRSGRIEDKSWIRVYRGMNRGMNRGYVMRRNTPLVGYVHRLVDKTLLPLQRSHPIARVSLTR